MSDQNGGFKKPLSLGFGLETGGYFSGDGDCGFNLSTFGGRLSFSFWKKGEKSDPNNPAENKLSLNISQVLVLNKFLEYIIRKRQGEFLAKGVEGYSDITNLTLTITGNINGQLVTFGVIRFDTVEIEGVKRVKMTVTKDTYSVSITFFDKYMKNMVQSNVSVGYDILDTSFLRFCTDICTYCTSGWVNGAFSKIFNVMVGKQNGNHSNSNGGGSSYNGGAKSARYNNSSPSSSSGSSEGGSGLFEDDENPF